MGRTVIKSIAIIGEGETEWFYFDSLRVACRYPFKVAPDFPQHSDINHILKLVESYLNKQYDFIVCLFDMDRLFQFPSEMQLYQRAKKKYSAKKYAGKVMFCRNESMYGILVLASFLAKCSLSAIRKLRPTASQTTKIYAGIRKNKTIFHTHQPLQILDREW